MTEEIFVALPDHEMAVGVVNIAGAGPRVATISNGEVRHMPPAAARRLARALEEDAHAAELRPVIDALREKAAEVEALLGLRDMPVAGHA